MVEQYLLNAHSNNATTLELHHFWNLSSLPPLPDRVTEVSIDNCPHLKCLPPRWPNGLCRLKIMCCESLMSLGESLPVGLASLELCNCPSLTELPANLPNSLMSLSLTGCVALTQLPENFPTNLANLNISFCHALQRIDRLPSGLLSLDVTQCRALTGVYELLPSRLLGLRIGNCSRLSVLPPHWPELLHLIHILDCISLTRLPQNVPTNLMRLNLRGCSSLTDVPHFPAQFHEYLPVHLRLLQRNPYRMERLPALHFDDVEARADYADSEIKELIDHFVRRMTVPLDAWLESFMPLGGGEAVSIATQNRQYIDGEIEQVKVADQALYQILCQRIPDLIATLDHTVIVAEQSVEGQLAIGALYQDIAYGECLNPSYLRRFMHAQLPSPLLAPRPISAAQQLRCEQLSDKIVATAKGLVCVPWKASATVMVLKERLGSASTLRDGGYAVHQAQFDRNLFASVLEACKQGHEQSFISAMGRLEAGWPTPSGLDVARQTFRETFTHLFVTGQFPSEWIKREYYHFILRCGQIH
ncbi:hypothetical protein QN363_03415 [Undibacterium sp. CCC2.1]|uniref:hypothetical protein n=1 Tax=unclassified Undibacterium TaxID=2630295 RepID=UPI002B2239A0|nr:MULTISPECIES: hypothetical protein [unclassified Undibacterium]MEB0138064.1 hypothetical protein [Undibacterium sp. CCC2.1]MEB0171198.1 hypothetical protein [Undibacterium sp. CCC1.1]MEB0175243.1 hypothetical protein [Undibacterium sp. CCC3.4]MEB0214651.1 hypothetical protein [Undibacterium sp. 5I2]